MSDTDAERQKKDLVFECELDAPPEKVWRAVSTPAFRDRWLPRQDLADAEPISTAPGEEVSYRMRDNDPPFLVSIVTFQVRPDANGGTILRIVHGLADTRLAPQIPSAANSNAPLMMLAA